MIADLRRSLVFRRKVRAARLRIVGKTTLPVDTLQIWREDLGSTMTFPIRRSPHYHLLVWHRHGGIRFTIEEPGLHAFRESQYYRWQVVLRGFHHARPDGWIEDMARRLLRLHDDIQKNGYRCRCIADRIAVFPDNRIWDGGHRLACLAAIGWTEAPVVVVRQI